MNAPARRVFTVGLSVSPCGDTDKLGFDHHALNKVVVRISEFFIGRNARMLFGHDWREDGVMRAVAAYAQAAVARGSLGGAQHHQRLVNLVPTRGKAVSDDAHEAMEFGGGSLEVLPIHAAVRHAPYRLSVDLPRGWGTDRVTELWILRRVLTEQLDPGLRICLGGRVSEFGGYYSGIVEEAFQALRLKKPLFLLPAFGGATRAVWDALQGKNLDDSLLARPKSSAGPHDPSLRKSVAKICGIPLGGLGPTLARMGLKQYCKNNGLTVAEARRLARITDIEEALAMIAARQTHDG